MIDESVIIITEETVEDEVYWEIILFNRRAFIEKR